jgi:hypothetical protein
MATTAIDAHVAPEDLRRALEKAHRESGRTIGVGRESHGRDKGSKRG